VNQGRRKPLAQVISLLLGVAVCVLTLDQLSKYLVLKYLRWGEPWNPISSLSRLVSLTPISNTGAVAGILPDQSTLFAIIAIIVVVGILIYGPRLARDDRWLQVVLGLQLGGAAGNLVDRLRLGYVIDFIDVKFWPIFNVADSAISIGTVILVLYLWRYPKAAAEGE
jgi:signal peptidase II